MCTKNELNSILQKLTQIYRSVYGENLVQVILYGSYARGDYHTDSDVDVVAIVHGDRKTLQQQLKKVWDSSCELELEYDTILSPTVIPYEEFKRSLALSSRYFISSLRLSGTNYHSFL